MLDHANIDVIADQLLKFRPYDVSAFKKRNPPCSIPDSESGIKLSLLEAAQSAVNRQKGLCLKCIKEGKITTEEGNCEARCQWTCQTQLQTT